MGQRRQGVEGGAGKGARKKRVRTEQGILVRGRSNLELLRPGTIPKPAPAAALNASRCSIELLLERIDGAKVAFERGFQLSVLELAAALIGRGEILPEERVIYVAYVPTGEREEKGEG